MWLPLALQNNTTAAHMVTVTDQLFVDSVSSAAREYIDISKICFAQE